MLEEENYLIIIGVCLFLGIVGLYLCYVERCEIELDVTRAEETIPASSGRIHCVLDNGRSEN